MRHSLPLFLVAVATTAVIVHAQCTSEPGESGDICLCETPGALRNVSFGDFNDSGTRTVPTNFTVGFLANGALTANGLAVLELAGNLSVDALIHPGGLDGVSDPDGWFAAVDAALGAGFPYFASIGEAEVALVSNYTEALASRWESLGDTACDGVVGVDTYCVHKGIGFSLTAPGILCSGAPDAISSAFDDGNNPPDWRFCGFSQPMQDVSGLGSFSPPNEPTGWAPYEACREAGAVVVTGDANVYARTKVMRTWDDVSPVFGNWPTYPSSAHMCPTDGTVAGRNYAMNVGIGGAGNGNGGGSSVVLEETYTVNDRSGAAGLVVCTFNTDGADENRADCALHTVGDVTPFSEWSMDVNDPSCVPAAATDNDDDDSTDDEDATIGDAQIVANFADDEQVVLFLGFAIGAVILSSIAIVKMWSIATSPSLLGEEDADPSTYLQKKGTTMTIGLEQPQAAQEAPAAPKAPSRFLPSMTAEADDDDDDEEQEEVSSSKKKRDIPVDANGTPLIIGEDSDDEDSDEDDPTLQGKAKASTEGTIMNLEDIFAMAKKGDTTKIDQKDSTLLKRPDDGDDSSDDSSDDSGPRRGSDRNKPAATKKKGSSGGGGATATVSSSASGRKGLRLRSDSDQGSARAAANNATAIMGLLAGGIGTAGGASGSGRKGSSRGSNRKAGSSRKSSNRKAAGSTHSSGSDRVKDAEKAKHHVIAPDDENTGEKAAAALAVLKMAIPDTHDGAAADKSLVATTGLTKRSDATSPDATAIVASRVAKSLSHQGAAEVGEAEFNAIVKNVTEDDEDDGETAAVAGEEASAAKKKEEKKKAEDGGEKKGSKRKGSSRRKKGPLKPAPEIKDAAKKD